MIFDNHLKKRKERAVLLILIRRIVQYITVHNNMIACKIAPPPPFIHIFIKPPNFLTCNGLNFICLACNGSTWSYVFILSTCKYTYTCVLKNNSLKGFEICYEPLLFLIGTMACPLFAFSLLLLPTSFTHLPYKLYVFLFYIHSF